MRNYYARTDIISYDFTAGVYKKDRYYHSIFSMKKVRFTAVEGLL